MSLTFTQFLYISVIEKGNDCITAYSDLADERISHEQVPEPVIELRRLDLKTVTVYPKSMIDTDSDVFTHYALTDSDVTEWTFTWIEDNNYYITAQVDGVTKYLSVYSEKVSDGGRLELLDEPNEYSVITIQNNGTEGRVGKLRFVNKDDWALNKKRL